MSLMPKLVTAAITTMASAILWYLWYHGRPKRPDKRLKDQGEEEQTTMTESTGSDSIKNTPSSKPESTNESLKVTDPGLKDTSGTSAIATEPSVQNLATSDTRTSDQENIEINEIKTGDVPPVVEEQVEKCEAAEVHMSPVCETTTKCEAASSVEGITNDDQGKQGDINQDIEVKCEEAFLTSERVSVCETTPTKVTEMSEPISSPGADEEIGKVVASSEEGVHEYVDGKDGKCEVAEVHDASDEQLDHECKQDLEGKCETQEVQVASEATLAGDAGVTDGKVQDGEVEVKVDDDESELPHQQNDAVVVSSNVDDHVECPEEDVKPSEVPNVVRVCDNEGQAQDRDSVSVENVAQDVSQDTIICSEAVQDGSAKTRDQASPVRNEPSDRAEQVTICSDEADGKEDRVSQDEVAETPSPGGVSPSKIPVESESSPTEKVDAVPTCTELVKESQDSPVVEADAVTEEVLSSTSEQVSAVTEEKHSSSSIADPTADAGTEAARDDHRDTKETQGLKTNITTVDVEAKVTQSAVSEVTNWADQVADEQSGPVSCDHVADEPSCDHSKQGTSSDTTTDNATTTKVDADSSTSVVEEHTEMPARNSPERTAPLEAESTTDKSTEQGLGSTVSSSNCNEIDLNSEASSDSGHGGSVNEVSTVDHSENIVLLYKFDWPSDLSGMLIGKKGRNIRGISDISGAEIALEGRSYSRDGHLECVIKGTQSQIDKALSLIRKKFPKSRFPHIDYTQTNPPDQQQSLIIPENMQLNLPEGVTVDVIVSAVVSPNHVFLQQPTHPTFTSLESLNHCMMACYAPGSVIPQVPKPGEVGMVCAAPMFNSWYRAQVISIYEATDECDIKFLDYGGYMTVPRCVLKQIRSDFISLPFQATECYLSSVVPLEGGEMFPATATSALESLVQGQMLQAQITAYAADNTPLVELYGTNEEKEGILINRQLVDLGAAGWQELDLSV